LVEIAQAGERLAILKARHQALHLTAAQTMQQQQDSHSAIEDIGRMGLEAFWQLPSTEQHQHLTRVMRSRRLVVLNNQIMGVSEKPRRERPRETTSEDS